jgi:hypothetical protein
MSTCISRHGEYSSHELDDTFVCARCAMLDEDAIVAELQRLRQLKGAHMEMIRGANEKIEELRTQVADLEKAWRYEVSRVDLMGNQRGRIQDLCHRTALPFAHFGVVDQYVLAADILEALAYDPMSAAAVDALSTSQRDRQEATCGSCGGARWVDDEGWQPEDYERKRVPFRQPGSGRIPCGICNHGGWSVPDGQEASDGA